MLRLVALLMRHAALDRFDLACTVPRRGFGTRIRCARTKLPDGRLLDFADQPRRNGLLRRQLRAGVRRRLPERDGPIA